MINDDYEDENTFDKDINDNTSDHDESDQLIIQKKITDMFNSIENLKKKLSHLNEEENILDKKIKKSQDVIEIKNASIHRLDIGIKLLENKFGDKYTRKKYTDELKKKKNTEEEQVCEILKEIGKFETDSNSKSWLKNWQSIKNQKILNTEKFKLMKYLGDCSKSIEDLFNIDDTNFNNMQVLIDRIFTQRELVIENTEDKISGNIHIKVFFKESLSSNELDKRLIETEDERNFHVFKIAIIDYDFFYNVNDRKLKIIEIKILACTFFGIELNEYLIVDENFRIWPYDIILFDEILQINLDKKFVKKNCKFFHLNPIISQNIKLVLIPRSYYEKICVTFDDLKFVEQSTITKNCKMKNFNELI